jgi:PTH2 family peptidyl-tRNA hydrolase
MSFFCIIFELMQDLSVLLACFISFAIGLLISYMTLRIPSKIPSLPLSKGQYKMVLVVRTDLDMTKGKIAAQCCHAAVALVEPLILSNDLSYQRWQHHGCTKIALRIDTGEVGLMEVYRGARKAGLESEFIRDAGWFF